MVVILCFLLALGAGQLACWTFCILASMEVSLISPGLGCWLLSLILNSHLIMVSSSYSHCKAFFGLSTLSLVCTLLRLLGNSWLLHPHLSRVLKILGGSLQAYPSRHPLQPLLFQVQYWMGDFFTQLLGYTLDSQAMILLFWDPFTLISDFCQYIQRCLLHFCHSPHCYLPKEMEPRSFLK